MIDGMRIVMFSRPAAIVAVILSVGSIAGAADPPVLARARTAYNVADYDAAIALAEEAITQEVNADVAALVAVRARLERFRLAGDSVDLSSAYSTLRAIAWQRLKPREQTELLVAQGLALYLGGDYGSAAELFDSALARVGLLGLSDDGRLLEWWALALDRQAQSLPADHQGGVYDRIAVRMEQAVRDNPASVPANFWLAAALRGAGESDRAWAAAMAAWVRVPIEVPGAQALRQDLDQLISVGVVPEFSRQHPRAEWDGAATDLESRWAAFKREWE